MEISTSELANAISNQHGGNPKYVEAIRIIESFHGKVVWEGIVHVFDLEDHPNATRAYAWSAPIEGSTKRRYFAVLHLGGIKSAQDAVRAAIVAEHRTKGTPARD